MKKIKKDFDLNECFHITHQIVFKLIIIHCKLNWWFKPFQTVFNIEDLAFVFDAVNVIKLWDCICKLDFVIEAGFSFFNLIENVRCQDISSSYCEVCRCLTDLRLFNEIVDFINVLQYAINSLYFFSFFIFSNNFSALYFFL